MIKARFYVTGQQHPVQDHEIVAAPRTGDVVELAAADGSPLPFVVGQVTWPVHDVIPADVVITLYPNYQKGNT